MGRWISTRAVRRAFNRQRHLALAFTAADWPPHPRFVGGADLAFEPGAGQRAGSPGSRAVAVAVVWDRQQRRCVEIAAARRRVRFPYVPGLLSFREAPILLAAIRRLQTPVDVWIFDGHGISHPRGCGLATHLGMLLNQPSVGAAKSRLCGVCATPPSRRGACAPLRYQGRLVGFAVRTEAGQPPLYVSPGFRCTPRQAAKLVLACALRHRLPEPTRLADWSCAQLRGVGAGSVTVDTLQRLVRPDPSRHSFTGREREVVSRHGG